MYTRPKYYKVHTDGHEVALEPIYEELVPVVHGRWLWTESKTSEAMEYECSLCGRRKSKKENYCPNCGAKMDLED